MNFLYVLKQAPCSRIFVFNIQLFFIRVQSAAHKKVHSLRPSSVLFPFIVSCSEFGLYGSNMNIPLVLASDADSMSHPGSFETKFTFY